jgi:hypothetical protein
MPYDSYGTYSLPSTYFVEVGDDVLPIQHNPPLEDIRAALSSVMVRDGRAAATGNWSMGGYKITNVLAGDAPGDVVTNSQLGDMENDAYFFGMTGG